MTSDPFPPPSIWRALTLAERVAMTRVATSSAHSDGPTPPRDAEDAARARFRLESWKGQTPFQQASFFARRLAQDGLNEESLRDMLSAPPSLELLSAGPVPPWVATIREAYESTEAGEPLALPHWLEKEPTAGFLALLTPLLSLHVRQFRSGAARIAGAGRGVPLDLAALERSLLDSLLSRLLWMLDRTLVLELNVARVEGKLEGEDPQGRFRDFVARLGRNDVAVALLEEYPVLARQVVERLESWVRSSLEILERLAEDRDALSVTFFGMEDPGPLVEISASAGDSHREGRSVALLRFSSGRRLVYKPHSLSLDLHFQELLAWIDRRGDHPPFRILKVLDRRTHGWEEFIEPAPCATAEEVRRYYVRLGGLLAVFYAIGAVDFHFENLIASGEHPIPIDLETLFHPRVPRPDPERPDERLAGRVLGESVLRVGLLPFRVGEDEKEAGLDLSGVSAVAGKQSQDRLLQWKDAGTDAMHAVKERQILSGGRNRPTLEGEDPDVADHIGEVTQGFGVLYRLLVRERDALMADDGPISRFADDPVRAVLRPTRAYGLLLEDSFHPDFLRDALDRDRFFDRLWVVLEEYPALERFAAFEHRDLWKGDIPYFHSRPESVDLWASNGARIEAFFPEPALEAVRRRILGMGEEDLFRQAWLTRVSLGTLLLNRCKGEWPGFSLADPGIPTEEGILKRRLVSAAEKVGDWFEKMAVRDAEHLTWVGLDLRNQIWSLFPISEDLYAGTPGIALFLAYLGEVTGESRFPGMARAGIRTLLTRLDAVAEQIPNIGMFQGWGGVIYTLAHLGKLWDDGALLRDAEQRVEEVAKRVTADAYLDAVAGSAGAIGGLLSLHAVTGSPRALEVARICGDRLVEKAVPSEPGVCWLTDIGGDDPQTGFSHGASGIALALIELWAATGQEKYKSTAMDGFAFERATLWPELQRWVLQGGTRVLSSEKLTAAERALAVSWCYGAPGAGLARARTLLRLDDPVLREDLDRAIAFTLERGFGKNHSLCHGDLGNLDLLTEALALAPDPALARTAGALTRAMLSSVEKDGWICGTVASLEAPGLMNGLAGIGFGLLRLACPEQVPSVLAMAPPPARH